MQRFTRLLTSSVRISFCVKSLDVAHLVLKPSKLEMLMSIMFCTSSHCCKAFCKLRRCSSLLVMLSSSIICEPRSLSCAQTTFFPSNVKLLWWCVCESTDRWASITLKWHWKSRVCSWETRLYVYGDSIVGVFLDILTLFSSGLHTLRLTRVYHNTQILKERNKIRSSLRLDPSRARGGVQHGLRHLCHRWWTRRWTQEIATGDAISQR